MKSASPEHWSKDFVEHLRTVHFTLLSISAGLILLLSSKAYDFKAAASQMTEVTKISSLSAVVPLITEKGIVTYQMRGNWVAFSATFVGTFRKQKFAFRVPEPNLFICGPSPGSRYDHADQSSLPNNIRDFSSWWASLLKSYRPLEAIAAISPVGKI